WRHAWPSGYLKSRTVFEQGGTQVEQETTTYQQAAGPVAMPRLSQRTMYRDGRTYSTQYQYDCTVAERWCDYNRPHIITESGETDAGSITRTTTLGYPYFFIPSANAAWMIFPAATQTVTIGSETFTNQKGYVSTTGFMQYEIVNGASTTYTNDAYGNVASL